MNCHVITALLISVLCGVTSPQQQTRCPRMCVCRDADVSGNATLVIGMVVVDCRGRSIVKVPDVKSELPVDVGELDLGRNDFRLSGSVIRMWFPPLTRLRLLRLDYCSLRRVESQAFRNIRFSIELIDLSNNVIDYIDRNAFREMPNLRVLRLASNRLGFGTGDGLPEMAFRGIEFDLLDLKSNDLTTLPDGLFDGVKRVTSLDLDDNRLVALNSSCLRLLRDSLRQLSISNNRCPLLVADDAIDGFSLSVLNFRRSGVKTLRFIENVASVETLDIGQNPIGAVSLTWFSSLALSCRLARLDAIGLEIVDGSLLSMFRSVVELDLSDNLLVTVDADEFRGKVPDLRHLDLSNCTLLKVSVCRLLARLPRLETLNLSSNSLSEIDEPLPSEPLAATALRSLDVTNNLIQIFPASLEPLFNRLNVVRISGNPIHCNCESAWLRQWLIDNHSLNGERLNVVDDVDNIRCSSPPLAADSTIPLSGRDVNLFVCRSPSIVNQTPNLVVVESTTVFLSCTAEGDPAPEVHWSSPAGEVLGVTPPADRRQNRSTAVWSTRRIRRKDAGWYVCNASSAVQQRNTGHSAGYTYVHVIVTGEVPLDLSELMYPALPPIALVAGSTKATSVILTTDKTDVGAGNNNNNNNNNNIVTEYNHTASEHLTKSTLPPTLIESLYESTTRAVDVTVIVNVTVSTDTLPLVFNEITTRVVNQVDTGGSSVPGETNYRRKNLMIVLCIGIGLAIVVLILIIVFIVFYIRFRERRRKRCYTRPISPNMTSTAICNKYASEDVMTVSRARAVSSPNTRTAGIGGGIFTPGISLAPSDSHAMRNSTDNVFAGLTFARRGPKSVDMTSAITSGSAENDELLNGNHNRGLSPTSMN